MAITARKAEITRIRAEGSAAYLNGAYGSAPTELSDADACHWLCGYFEAEKSFQRELKHALSTQIDAIDDFMTALKSSLL